MINIIYPKVTYKYQTQTQNKTYEQIKIIRISWQNHNRVKEKNQKFILTSIYINSMIRKRKTKKFLDDCCFDDFYSKQGTIYKNESIPRHFVTLAK